MNKNDIKVLKAITATEAWLASHTDLPSVDEHCNFTIAGCERRNLKIYKEMLGQDKRKLTGWVRELYLAI